MKCEFNPSEYFKFEIENSDIRGMFEQVAEIDEIFSHEPCGDCGSANVRFSTRLVDDNRYFEKVCNDCGAKLAFGQNKKGNGLFPKRKNDDGSWDYKTKGWHKYVPQDQSNKTNNKRR